MLKSVINFSQFECFVIEVVEILFVRLVIVLRFLLFVAVDKDGRLFSLLFRRIAGGSIAIRTIRRSVNQPPPTLITRAKLRCKSYICFRTGDCEGNIKRCDTIRNSNLLAFCESDTFY